jgi:hypothetical protein
MPLWDGEEALRFIDWGRRRWTTWRTQAWSSTQPDQDALATAAFSCHSARASTGAVT